MLTSRLKLACAAVVLIPAAANAQSTAPSYKLLRFEEDYRYLSYPARRSDFWDRIKYIGLGDTPDTYLSFGGELRERFEHYSAPTFGVGGRAADGYLLHRLLVSADLHVTDGFRAFVQLGNHLDVDKEEPLSPTDVDRLDLQQAFIDVTLSSAPGAVVRAGRQELSYGSQRLIAVRDPANLRRSFDGVRLFDTLGSVRLDVFATRPVQLKQGTFDDASNDAQAFWGVYMTAPQQQRHTAFDLYYLGFSNDQARYGGVPGREHRHTFGTRLFGSNSSWDWNFEVVGQLGSFGAQDIRAWTFASDTGYTLAAMPWAPRIGFKADVASGDQNPSDRTLGTFNPLFPRLGYFSEASLISPNNVIDIQPTLTLRPTEATSLALGWNMLWRQTTSDAIYTGTSTPVPGTAGQGGRSIGNQTSVDVTWEADRHTEIKASYVYFNVGNALRDAGGRDTTFTMISVAYKL